MTTPAAKRIADRYIGRDGESEPTAAQRPSKDDIIRAMLEDFVTLIEHGVDDLRQCENSCCGAWMTMDECASLVADVQLCPKAAFGSQGFQNDPCYSDRIWRRAIDQKFDFEATLSELIGDAIAEGEKRARR